MRPRLSTSPVILAELTAIEPLASATAILADPTRGVEQVILAETIDRVRHSTPHSLVVLHGEAATGGWSLAAALHLAWERNVSAVVVTRTVAGTSSESLARRLNMSLVLIDADAIDVALQLAGLVSAPDAARALRRAVCAEHLAEQGSIRGVLGVLNTELGAIPAALVVGHDVIAGRAAAVVERGDTERVVLAVNGPGERTWAHLVAAVPLDSAGTAEQVEALFRLARPPLLAAWAQSRVNSATHAGQEQAAFGLLRRLATEPADETPAPEPAEVETPLWSSELGWQVERTNRAVWLTPSRPPSELPDELTHLVRTAWQRARPNWPLFPEGDGWISWQSSDNAKDTAPLRRALTAFHDTAVAHELVVGVGRPHAGVTGLLRSVAEARLAGHVARDAVPGSVQWFEQVGPTAALAWLPVNEIAQVAELSLSELMSAKDRTALVDTALAVLDCGGSLSQASGRLGVHRNTVLARISRARQLGLTLDDPAQRLAVHVICYALSALNDQSSPPGEAGEVRPAGDD
jgi:hypothetical protein